MATKEILSRLLPSQIKGKHNDLEHTVNLATHEEANLRFEKACQRLFNVNDWQVYSKDKLSSFCVTDANGNILQRAVKEGDFLRIDLPGPGSSTGDGYDWVRVETKLAHYSNDDYEGAGFTVRATRNPQRNSGETAHFFKGNATSTFMVERRGTTLLASYHGRNEVINTDESESLLDKIRNAVVGAGAKAGLSEVKWKELLISFLKE